MQHKWAGASLPYVRPRRPGETDAWTEESAGQRGSQRLTQAGTATPPRDVAERLGLTASETAIVRRRVMEVAGEAVELVDSWYPLAIGDGTALAEHKKIRGGAPTLLAELGFTAHRVIEEVGIRAATDWESSQLGLPDGENVLTLLRQSLLRDDRPLEVSLMVMKGPRQIRYEIEVD